MANVAELLQLFQTDPEFAKMSYDQQVEARAGLLAPALRDDPEFVAMDPATRSLTYNNLVVGAPVLQDKSRETQMHQLVKDMSSQDPQVSFNAKRQVESISNNQAFAASSLVARGLGWVEGKAMEGMISLMPKELQEIGRASWRETV